MNIIIIIIMVMITIINNNNLDYIERFSSDNKISFSISLHSFKYVILVPGVFVFAGT